MSSAVAPSSVASLTSRPRRSTRGLTEDWLLAPLMRSPSQWPGALRAAPSGGRMAIEVMLGPPPLRSVPRARGRRVLGPLRGNSSSSLRSVVRGMAWRAPWMVSCETECKLPGEGTSAGAAAAFMRGSVPAICSGDQRQRSPSMTVRLGGEEVPLPSLRRLKPAQLTVDRGRARARAISDQLDLGVDQDPCLNGGAAISRQMRIVRSHVRNTLKDAGCRTSGLSRPVSARPDVGAHRH
jgi:hypothetical protein